METVLAAIVAVAVLLSPTRLEGMETPNSGLQFSLKPESPTRLEGMETNLAALNASNITLVSDPP